MTTPTPDPIPDPSIAVQHFVLGAIPTVVAAIAVIIQVADPYLGANHRELLYVLVVISVMISMTVWLWCTVKHVSAQFLLLHQIAMDRQKERFDHVDAGQMHVEKIALGTQRSIEGLHRRQEQMEANMEALMTENEHLRRLFIEGADYGAIPQQHEGQRLGPRSVE